MGSEISVAEFAILNTCGMLDRVNTLTEGTRMLENSPLTRQLYVSGAEIVLNEPDVCAV